MFFSRIDREGVRIGFGLIGKVLLNRLFLDDHCFFIWLNICFVDGRFDWEVRLFLFFDLFRDSNGIVVALQILHSEESICKSIALFVLIFVFHFYLLSFQE